MIHESVTAQRLSPLTGVSHLLSLANPATAIPQARKARVLSRPFVAVDAVRKHVGARWLDALSSQGANGSLSTALLAIARASADPPNIVANHIVPVIAARFPVKELVGCLRHHLKVVWVAAGRVAAKMVQHHPRGDWPTAQLVCGTMGCQLRGATPTDTNSAGVPTSVPMPWILPALKGSIEGRQYQSLKNRHRATIYNIVALGAT